MPRPLSALTLRRVQPLSYRHGQIVTVRVEVARWGHVKRSPTGRVDFISPIPSPFNYGSIEGTRSDDGEPHDALVLGPTLRRGAQAELPVLGIIAFLDAGVFDPKVVVGNALSARDRRDIEGFFRVYAKAKRLLDRWRPRTRYDGWLLAPLAK